MICEKCGKEHDGTFGSGRFCSRSCANAHFHSKEQKEKISNSVKKRLRENMYERICEKCGKTFFTRFFREKDAIPLGLHLNLDDLFW